MKVFGCLALMLFVLFLPMFFFAETGAWLYLVVPAIFLAPVAVVVLFLPKSAQYPINPRSAPTHDLMTVCLVAAVVLFVSEFSVSATVLAYRHDWILVQSASSWIADGLAVFVPALWRLPDEMAAAGFSGRIDVVRGATGVGYLFGLLLAGFIMFDPSSVVSRSIECVRSQPSSRPRSSRLTEFVWISVVFGSTVGMLLQFDFISELQRDDFGIFDDIRKFDAALVHQMWVMPIIVFGGLAISIRSVLYRIGEINKRIDAEN